jgi:hypothetical protein
MLFAQKLLAPGPQPKHPGNVNPVLDTGPPAEPGVYLKEIRLAANFLHGIGLNPARSLRIVQGSESWNLAAQGNAGKMDLFG